MEKALTEYQQNVEKNWQRLEDSGYDLSHLAQYEQQIKQVFGLSDFVADVLVKHPNVIVDLVTNDSTAFTQEEYKKVLNQSLQEVEQEPQLQQRLRQFRNIEMAKITWRDVLNHQSIETSLQQVSELADALICEAYQWVYQHLCNRYGTPQGEFGNQPLLILGMGKLGGKELNFSSDIDLIFAYPSNGEIPGTRKSIEHHQFFTKVAQKLISVLHQTTADGQVFRVDMRLRPFGDSGPLVTQFSALEDYYQDQGREWERYAMIKARILNHEGPYAEQLANILKPFVYRRYLDFGAIDSLRNMKQLISQEVRRRGLHNNIKLGAGGIREVEFIVQSFQLIRGGRESQLQHPGLLENLSQLADLGALPDEEVKQVRTSYLFLRKVEHCLQQFNDQQTQLLPDTALDQQRLTSIMGYQDYPQLLAELDFHRDLINTQFVSLIGDHEQQQTADMPAEYSDLRDIWQLDLTVAESTELLQKWLSAEDAEAFCETLNSFRTSLSKKGLSQKGQDTLHILMPVLLKEILVDYQGSSNQVLSRCLTIISAIMGRTTYLQLLNENQGALGQLVRLCAASPWITEQIRSFPLLLDELLNPAQLYHPPELTEYHSELRQVLLRIDPDDLELQMETLRQFKLSQQLKIAAADVTDVLPLMQVSDHLTYLAEALIKEVVSLAWYQITDKHGAPEGTDHEHKGFAVIGYGKLGGLELGYGSDLDLVFIHNVEARTQTNGDKPIEAARFYAKLAQRIMHLFNTKTPSGQLYEIDMRLRPSGNAGLLVCHVNGFNHYQFEEAWTWEHQAIVRARLIYAEPTLAEAFNKTRDEVIRLQRQEAKLNQDVKEMREKMRNHLSKGSETTFDIKQDKGGIADIEFLVQYWVLANAATIPYLSRWSDNVRILETLCHQGVIDEKQASTLAQAYIDYRNASHRLALQQLQVLEDSQVFSKQREQVSAIWQEVFSG